MFAFFEGLLKPFPPEHPSQPPKSLFSFCWHYTKGATWALATLGILSALVAMLEVYLFAYLGNLVDLVGNTEATEFFSTEHDRLWLMAGILLVALPLIVYLHSLIMFQTLIGNFPMQVRWKAHRHMMLQSLGFFQSEFAGRIATKVMQTALSVREAVMKTLDVFVYVLVYFLSIVALVASADWRLAVPLAVWFIFYLLILNVLLPKLRAVSAQQADARSIMTGRIVDSYTNISTVKLFSHTQRENDYAQEGMRGFIDTVYPQMRLVTVLNITVWINNALLVAAVTGMSLYLWADNSITAGDIAIAVSLSLRLNGMSQWIMWEVSSLFEHLGTVQDGMNTLSNPITVKDKTQAAELSVKSGAIDFCNVLYRYDQQPPIFDGLQLQIKAGEKVGLVGRSGAGKSTLVNLLLRFYDIEQGHIQIDQQDISGVRQDSLRANISMVTQDTSLLHRTIRENIAYGKPAATEAEIIDAAKRAEAHDFIMSLSDANGNSGYDVAVGERGVKLSGGQRQRVAIARVLLKDAPILILDEATSALDSEVESVIQTSLNNIMHDKTVLAIAHRLSTISAMDRLIVLDQGQVVESGSHAELLAKKGIYAKLWAHQTGGFLGTD